MWWFSGAEVILVMSAFGACCSGLIVAYCRSQRQSRCNKITICCGCFQCERDVETVEEMALEQQAEVIPRERSGSNENIAVQV